VRTVRASLGCSFVGGASEHWVKSYCPLPSLTLRRLPLVTQVPLSVSVCVPPLAMACIAACASFLVIALLPGLSFPYIYRKLGPLVEPIANKAFLEASLLSLVPSRVHTHTSYPASQFITITTTTSNTRLLLSSSHIPSSRSYSSLSIDLVDHCKHHHPLNSFYSTSSPDHIPSWYPVKSVGIIRSSVS
jgi:hypothetical protein